MDANDPPVKSDAGKSRYDLLPARALQELADVYTFGASKYAPRNWEAGLPFSRIFAALMRHSWAFWRGETIDSETKLHHMAHAAFGCLALVEYFYTKKGEDDRP